MKVEAMVVVEKAVEVMGVEMEVRTVEEERGW